MEYLFLRRKKTRYTSVRQKTLLYRAASRRWEKEFALRTDVRRIDALIYKGILYLMEVRQVFLDSSLSLKTLSAMLETNQTYLSNVVNRYFGCNLKELVNTYRVEYAFKFINLKFFYYEQKVFKCNPVRSLNGFVNRNICVL